MAPTKEAPPVPVEPFRGEIVLVNSLIFLVAHLLALYGAYLYFFFIIKWQTWIFATVFGLATSQGILLGAHRYYSHRSFKATLPLRILIIIFQTISSQNCLWVWVRDHRQHHKFSDTDADPHNASRGFFFSHVGWLMMRKHPEVIRKGKTIDMSDLDQDPLVMFQKKYYLWLYFSLAFALPTFAPMILFGETFANSFFVSFLLRTVLILNFTWMVNSWAHAFGTKPYDKTIRPVETLVVSVVSFGEGWHNYHHTFPWDYKASEFGLHYNPTTKVIEFFARLGWAYDLKSASPDLVRSRTLRSGDGSHHTWGSKKASSPTIDSNANLVD